MNQLAALTRVGAQALRNSVRRGGDGGWPGGKFWSEGTQTGHNGFLFGEIPPPHGQSRKWQWWEPIWYAGYGTFFAGVYLIYQTKPLEALDIKYWAKPRAEAELDMELKMLDKLDANPELKQRLAAVGAQLNMIDDEMYDLVLMRNEYKVLMGLHSGRVPAELKEIYEELAAE